MKSKTVERLMNETPEHIKQQVSDYADALVNKKQSSIDWLVEQLIPNAMRIFDATTCNAIEQAKAMHKEEMKEMYLKGIKNYDPKFGGNNE